MRGCVAIILILLLNFCSLSHQGIFDDIVSNTIGSIVDDVFGPTVDHTKDAFVEAFNQVFDEKIHPLVQELEATLDRDLTRVEDDVKNLEKEIETFITFTIKQIALEAKSLVNFTVEEIKSKIIDNLFDKAEELARNVFKDLNKLLNRLSTLVEKVDCTVLSVKDSMLDFLKGLLKEPVPWPWEKCRRELAPLFPAVNFRTLPVYQMDTLQLYSLRKCRLLSALKANTPIKTVKFTYLELQEAASKARCAAVASSSMGSPSDLDVFMTRELAKASYMLHVYDDVPDSSPLKNKMKIVAEFDVSADPKCNTPQECFTLAYAALREAQKDVQKFKDLATVAYHTSIEASNASREAISTAQDATSLAKASTTTANSAQGVANSAQGVANSAVSRLDAFGRNGRCYTRQTQASDNWGLRCLDRYPVVCQSGEILTGFWVTSTDNTIQYHYTCCNP